MKFGFRTQISQAQVFRLGQVVGILQMSSSELDDHLRTFSQENPFLTFRGHPGPYGGTSSATDVLEATAKAELPGLYAHVFAELSGLMAQSEGIERLVVGLVEELEPSGWLGRPVAEIARRLDVTNEVMELALKLVQKRVTPAGLFARDLADCLRLQLEDRELMSPAMAAVLEHLAALEAGGVPALVEATGLASGEVARCLSLIRRLDPKPGTAFCDDPTLMREPDVTVSVSAWKTEIAFRSAAVTDIKAARLPKSERWEGMREALSKARALERVLDLRRSAMEQVIRVLVERQERYFIDGPEALMPLSMTDVAEATGFHLSTVSRVLKGLLIEGPGGIVEARVLCAGSASAGDGPSRPKVQSRIRALIGGEIPGHPLSDRKLTSLLEEEGIDVSRRVVAKYRQQIGLPPASVRRRQADNAASRSAGRRS